MKAFTIGSLVLTLLLSAYSFADDKKHEIYAGTSSNTTIAAVSFYSNTVGFNLGGGYNYSLNSVLQLGFDFYFSYYNNRDYSSYSYIVPLIGPTINFGGDDIQNDYFVFAQVGATRSNSYYNYSGSSYSASNGALAVGFGKRFKLTESVSFRPNIRALAVSNSSTDIQITLLSFAIHL